MLWNSLEEFSWRVSLHGSGTKFMKVCFENGRLYRFVVVADVEDGEERELRELCEL